MRVSLPSISALLLLALSSCTAAKPSSVKSTTKNNNDAYLLLAQSIQSRLNAPPSKTSTSNNNNNNSNNANSHKIYDVNTIATALRSLSTSQAALKKIDGAAHEAYQRTHISSTNLAAAAAASEDEDDPAEGDNKKGSKSKSGGGLGGLKVAGRMTRNAARVGCVADSLFAAELCELIALHPPIMTQGVAGVVQGEEEEEDKNGETENGIENENLICKSNNMEEDEEGTLASYTNRFVVLNTTIFANGSTTSQSRKPRSKGTKSKENIAISILVLYEPFYRGGAGINHGGVDDLLSFTKEEITEDSGDSMANNGDPTDAPRGRYLVILSDQTNNSSGSTNSNKNELSRILSTLDEPPLRLALRSGLVTNEVASVCAPLYRMAGKVLEVVGPVVMQERDANGKLVQNSGKESGSIQEDDSEADEDEETEKEEKESTMQTNIQGSDDSAAKENSAAAIKSATNTKKAFKSNAAVHFVGHSLSGGIAALSANILDGSLPMPGTSNKPKGKRRRNNESNADPSDNESKASELKKGNNNEDPSPSTWCGYARARSSALCLGPPPCISPNLKSAFVTSIIHGDDIVCRTSHNTIEHLCDRTRRSIQSGVLGRSVGWMSDAVSLTVSGLKSHAHGSEGEEGKLAVPGKVYLIRPRRMGGGSSSIHEVGGASGGREALRAAVLWQLNDVLLSGSLWSHHSLDAYIRSLDKVHLRGFSDQVSDE